MIKLRVLQSLNFQSSFFKLKLRIKVFLKRLVLHFVIKIRPAVMSAGINTSNPSVEAATFGSHCFRF